MTMIRSKLLARQRPRSPLLLFLALLICACACACGGGGGGEDSAPRPPAPPEYLRASVERNLSPQVTPAAMETLVSGHTAFALNLHQALRKTSGNLFFSPYSISGTLATLFAGARGETRQEMAEALSFHLPDELLHPAVNALDLTLAGREGSEGETATGFRLRLANALWLDTATPVQDGYLETLARHYGAGAWRLDFQNGPEAARDHINAWVEENTEGRIGALLPPGTISPQTRLVTTNAIYFRAAWKTPFDPDITEPGPFYPNGADPTEGALTVPFMRHKERFGYSVGDGFQAVELPYEGELLSMVILLPEAGGLSDFENQLTEGFLSAILADLTPRIIRLALPRFELTPAPLSLSEALIRMGMSTVFTSAADLSGIDGTGDLALSEVVHQTYLAVDETGTEAAAGTGGIVGPSNPGLPFAEVTVDRPFLVIIRDIPTESILFFGRIASPDAQPADTVIVRRSP